MISMLTQPMARELGDEAALQMLADAGFAGLDYSMNTYPLDSPLYSLPREALAQRYAALRQTMDGLSLHACQLHTHFPTYVGDGLDERRFEAVVAGIWAAQALGSPYAVVHPMMLNKPADSDVRMYTWDMNRQFYTRLIPTLRECGVQLGVENMFIYTRERYQQTPLSTAQDMITYIDRMNDIAGEELFVACLDTGHAHLLGLDVADMAKQLGKRLKLLHIHDNACAGDVHTAPYLGGIDWNAFLNALHDIGYGGHLSFETHGFVRTFPLELMPESLRMLAGIGKMFERQLARAKNG